jgi:hypothetical protein
MKKDHPYNTDPIPGRTYMQIMIASPQGLPVQVGSITIDTNPLLVEDWMLEEVSRNAAKSLTKFVLESNVGKVIN